MKIVMKEVSGNRMGGIGTEIRILRVYLFKIPFELHKCFTYLKIKLSQKG